MCKCVCLSYRDTLLVPDKKRFTCQMQSRMNFCLHFRFRLMNIAWCFHLCPLQFWRQSYISPFTSSIRFAAEICTSRGSFWPAALSATSATIWSITTSTTEVPQINSSITWSDIITIITSWIMTRVSASALRPGMSSSELEFCLRNWNIYWNGELRSFFILLRCRPFKFKFMHDMNFWSPLCMKVAPST